MKENLGASPDAADNARLLGENRALLEENAYLKRLLEAQESRQTSRTTDTLDGKFLRQTSADPAAVPAEKASNASNVSPLSGPTELPEAAQVPRVVPPARRASPPPLRTTSPQLSMWHIPQTQDKNGRCR